MAPKRRIVPDLISTENGPSPSGGPSDQFPAASNTEYLRMSTWLAPDVKEDSELAAKKGKLGQRFYVPLKADEPTEVSWTKLLKEQGLTLDDLLQADKKGQSIRGVSKIPLAAALNGVHQQCYKLSDDDSSDDEDDEEDNEEGADKGEDSEEGGSESESDSETGSDVLVGNYDYDDGFIDDSEMTELMKGDRREPKHAGFFINKGEIEKGDKEAPLIRPEPVKKARKRPRGPVTDTSEGELTETDAEGQRRKQTVGGSPRRGPKKAKLKGSAREASAPAEEPAARSEAAMPISIAAQAAAAGTLASAAAPSLGKEKKLPPAPNPSNLSSGAAKEYKLSATVKLALDALKPAVTALREDDQHSGDHKAIPKSLNPLLLPVARLLHQETEVNLKARDVIIDEVVDMFGGAQNGLYSRAKITKRLDSLAKSSEADLATVTGKIKDHIEAKLRAADERLSHGEGSSPDAAPTAEDFNFDKNLEHHILTFVLLINRFKGVPDESADLRGPLDQLLAFWPPDRMSIPVLQAALQRAALNPKSHGGNRTHRKSMDSAEAGLSAGSQTNEVGERRKPHATLPRIVEEAAAAATVPQKAEESPKSQGVALKARAPDAAAAAPATVVVERAAPSFSLAGTLAAAAAPTVPNGQESAAGSGLRAAIEAAAMAVSLGADRGEIDESIRAANNLTKIAVNTVLMGAGPKGLLTLEIIDRANALKLTGEQRWDKNKRNTITQSIRSSKHHGHIGAYRYAHLAFPGTRDLAEKEAKRREKELKSDQAKLSQPGSQAGVSETASQNTIPTESQAR